MSEKDKKLTLISTATGCVGIANIAILGIYIINRCLRLSLLFPNFLTEATVVAIAAFTSSAMLLYGSYLIHKGQGSRGGIFNILAGAMTIIIYVYYTINWKFPLLVQLGTPGYVLLIPAPISGILGILISKMRTQN